MRNLAVDELPFNITLLKEPVQCLSKGQRYEVWSIIPYLMAQFLYPISPTKANLDSLYIKAYILII